MRGKDKNRKRHKCGRMEIKREKPQEREERERKRGGTGNFQEKRARRGDTAHNMKTTEGGGREKDWFEERGRRRMRERTGEIGRSRGRERLQD